VIELLENIEIKDHILLDLNIKVGIGKMKFFYKLKETS
jgi:hypothetical protein